MIYKLLCGCVVRLPRGSRTFAVLIVGTLNLIHPLIHGFEGGGLDVWLTQLDGLLLQIDPFLAERHHP